MKEQQRKAHMRETLKSNLKKMMLKIESPALKNMKTKNISNKQAILNKL